MHPAARLVPSVALLAALAFASPVRAADTPQPAAVPAPSPEDMAVLEEAVAWHDPKFFEGRATMKPEEKQKILLARWAELTDDGRALFLRRSAWLRSHIQEADVPPQRTDRGLAYLIASPPGLVYSEAARDWSGQPAVQNKGLDDLNKILTRGAKAVGNVLEPAKPETLSILPAMPIEGAHPTEIWVTSITATQRRILYFVDLDGTGHFRLVRDEIVPSETQVSTAVPQELPPDLFPVAAAAHLQPLPALTTDAVKPRVVTSFYKALESKSLVRFTTAVEPSDIDLELGSAPDAYHAKAQIWFQIEKDGKAVWQDHLEAAKAPLEVQDGLWLTEFSVPLPPGEYSWTSVLTDGAGKGGRSTGTVTVPALGGLALSSVVVVKAEGSGDSAALPLAPPAHADAKGQDELAPFQVGKYLVKPRVKGVFKAGETLAVVYQVYGSSPAIVKCQFWRGPKYIPGIEDVTVSQFPAFQALPQDVTEAWPADAYKVVVTATDVADPTKTAKQEVEFRISN